MKALLVCSLIALSSLLAQDPSRLRVVGVGERLPDELVDARIKDANGQVCAGLVLASDLDGLTFQSNNGIVRATHDPGRDFLFLSPGEKVVTVYRSGFLPLKILLLDHGIRLKSGTVWQLKISAEAKKDLIPVSIIVTPPDAVISIDGVIKGSRPSQAMTAGAHVLRIEKAGYLIVTDSVEVSLTSALFTYSLRRLVPSKVLVSSLPPGATILINNIDKGKTDRDVFLFPGKHRLQLILTGYEQVDREIDIASQDTLLPPFSLERFSSALRLHIDPEDATVLLNREDHSGKRDIDLAPGRYTLEVKREGYVDTTDIIEIERGSMLEKTYVLIPRKGSLEFSVQPREARTTLRRGGKEVESWEGSRFRSGLPVGTYELETVCEGYETVSRSVVIEEEKTTVEDLALKVQPAREPEVVQREVEPQSERPRARSFFGAGMAYGTPEGDFAGRVKPGFGFVAWAELGIAARLGLDFTCFYQPFTETTVLSGLSWSSYAVFGGVIGTRFYLTSDSPVGISFGPAIGYGKVRGEYSSLASGGLVGSFFSAGTFESSVWILSPFFGASIQTSAVVLRLDCAYRLMSERLTDVTNPGSVRYFSVEVSIGF